MKQPLAFSPENAPHDPAAFEIVNLFSALESFSFAEIIWNQESNDLGEVRGTWEFGVQVSDRFIRAYSPDFNRALWAAVRTAEAANDEAYLAQKKAYDEALAKLSPQDRKALGI